MRCGRDDLGSSQTGTCSVRLAMLRSFVYPGRHVCRLAQLNRKKAVTLLVARLCPTNPIKWCSRTLSNIALLFSGPPLVLVRTSPKSVHGTPPWFDISLSLINGIGPFFSGCNDEADAIYFIEKGYIIIEI